MEIRRRIAIITALFFCLSLSSVLEAYEIQGKIAVAPPFPALKKIQVHKKQPDSCASEQISQSLIVSPEGFLKNAVISLKSDKDIPFPEPAGPVPVPELDQKDCNFSPHVFVVREDRPFHVLNSDPMAHDVRIFDGAQMLDRFEMDEKAKPVERSLKKSGTYLLRCGLHPWMHAFVVSAPNSYYAVSGENGEFVLRDVPAGNYVIHVWHETLGEADVPVKIEKSIEDFSYTFQNAAA
ncbi:MAG: hypothetical protein HYZ84_06765 [Candidatus Omnitrophica bacterium]|nr:hypothetical protein [Candidatus Omnitrophota bacterium]